MPDFGIKIDGRTWFVLCAQLLLLGWEWTGAIVLAAVVHEMGHLIALRLYGLQIHRIIIHPFGATIHTELISGKDGILCALAGPFSGGLLLCLWPIAPKLAVAALLQTVFNLLPIYPLDGGRALRYWMEQKAVAKSICSGYNKSD